MSPHDKTAENEAEEEPFGLGCALEMFTEVDEVLGMIANLKNICEDESLKEGAYERFQFIITQYKEQPHLLDAHMEKLLETFISIIRDDKSPVKLKHSVFQYMSVVVNVRGYKIFVRQLPHEVADFEVVLKMLEEQDPNDPDTWTTRYILLLWLSIIVMIPFHLARFDGFDGSEQEGKKTVMTRVLDMIKTYMVNPDKCRDAAAYLSARFITRNDVKDQLLPAYLDWAIELSLSPVSNVFVKFGTLYSVAMILKHGKREDLLPHARRLLEWIVNEEIKNNAGTSIHKLVYKVVQRIGLVFLPPRVATWRYNRGNRSLAANLCGGDGKTSSEIRPEQNEQAPEDIEVPEEVEEVIDQLIQGLRSVDGIARWSAAKGIGRITGRLPQELADEVVGSVLELFSPREGDGAWHGGCLALAELGRRGLLLPKRLPEVVPVFLKALVYDEPRGYSSVGSHIRDAACFVAWSFARAYDTHILQPYVTQIASMLLIVTCFDREINCRRAASAAFQENVGRQGTFPHGIDILTKADFFAVSVRNNAYLNISVYVADFVEYTVPLIDHLINRKVDHWDSNIRSLTAKTLHNLTPKNPSYMSNSVLPALFDKAHSIDLNSRHGAVLAIGEILHALSKISISDGKSIETAIDVSLVNKTKELVPDYQKKFYFRGMGGELMREACCSLIGKCSLAALNFHNEAITSVWLNLLNECIAYNVALIRNSAIEALPVLLEEYFATNTKKLDLLVKMYIKEVQETTQEETRMGHALALGALPEFVLHQHLNDIINCLVDSMALTNISFKWAEGRRDTIKALTALAMTMGEKSGNEFTENQILKIYSVFLGGLKDYTQDKRGDVGAWIREAAVVGLHILTSIVVEHHPLLLTEELVVRILAGVAQQAVERIDRTRALAAKTFYAFLHRDVPIPNVPHFAELVGIFSKDDYDGLNWNSAADTFPKFVELVQFAPYTYNVMLGMICSIGGLTETLVKHSGASLFAYFKREEKSKGVDEIRRLCGVIYQIFVDHRHNDRVTVPMFRFLDKLFSSGCVRLILDDAGSSWAKDVLKLILAEIAGCKDVYKLVDAVNILSQYLQVHNESSQSALVQLSILLCHRQIYIRRSTSTILYEALLVYGDNCSCINVENLDQAMQLLSNTNWEDPVDVVRPVRNELCTLMGIRVPVAKRAKSPVPS